MTRTNILDGVTYALPSLDGTSYNHEELVSYLDPIQKRNLGIGFGVHKYTHGASCESYAYLGAVYSPNQNRIYLCPYGQADVANWHYINCDTGEVVAYAHGGSGIVDRAYYGGVYCPTQDRIYFVPFGQANEANWHYINCKDGSLNAYAHGTSAHDEGYRGGVYSPTQNRIYFSPNSEAPYDDWHYIDCTSTGNEVVAYTHGVSAVASAYTASVYVPTQNRIYFMPDAQAGQTNWHYIDCTSTGSVVAYAHGTSGLTTGSLGGGVFVPSTERIYIQPYSISDEATWYYIDVSGTNNTVTGYSHGLGTSVPDSAFAGITYSPITNRIYLAPLSISDETTWYYIDCTSTGEAVSYSISSGAVGVNNAHGGSIYSPRTNRIYFVPVWQSTETGWYYVQEYTNDHVPASVHRLLIGA